MSCSLLIFLYESGISSYRILPNLFCNKQKNVLMDDQLTNSIHIRGVFKKFAYIDFPRFTYIRLSIFDFLVALCLLMYLAYADKFGHIDCFVNC